MLKNMETTWGNVIAASASEAGRGPRAQTGESPSSLGSSDVSACSPRSRLRTIHPGSRPSRATTHRGVGLGGRWRVRQPYDNLERFGVFLLVPADSVPADEDIFDTMLLCKVKRGKNNVCLKKKVRCVLCGNQMVASAKRGLSKTTTDLRTHSPAVRGSSITQVQLRRRRARQHARMLDFDIDAAYLQG